MTPDQDPIDAEFEPAPPTFPYTPASPINDPEEQARILRELAATPIPPSAALIPPPAPQPIPNKYADMPPDDLIIEALQNNKGLLFYTAKALRVTSTKLRRYITHKPNLQEALRQIEGETADQAEATVHTHLDMGRLDAAKFYLTTKAKDRGYTTRQELTNPDGTPLSLHSPANPSIDLTTLTTEQLIALRDILRPPNPAPTISQPDHNTPPARQPAYQKTQSAPRR